MYMYTFGFQLNATTSYNIIYNTYKHNAFITTYMHSAPPHPLAL